MVTEASMGPEMVQGPGKEAQEVFQIQVTEKMVTTCQIDNYHNNEHNTRNLLFKTTSL